MDAGEIHILNDSECEKIVRKALKSTNVADFSIRKYFVTRGSKELVGFMGEYFKLVVYFQKKNSTAEEQLHFFVKCIPISNEYYRDECERKGFFNKETRIYNEILYNIQKYASTKLFPECYYTRKDLIVLEDLSASKEGLKHIESHEDFSLEHHKIVLKHHAKLHAASLAWEQAESFNIGERFNDVLFELQLSLANEWYITGIKGIIFLAKMHDKFQSASQQDFINNKLYQILENACTLTDPSKNLRNVLCHRDSWDRNIFFKYNAEGVPIDCRIVDFQLTRYSPPSMDVLYLLYVTSKAERRNQIYDFCLDFYYECLAESMKSLNLSTDLISRSEFLEGCKRSRLAVLIMWVICVPLMKMPAGLSNKMRAEEPERFDYYMNTQRDEMFVRIMEMYKGYKNIIMAPVEELIEYLLENKELCEEFS